MNWILKILGKCYSPCLINTFIYGNSGQDKPEYLINHCSIEGSPGPLWDLNVAIVVPIAVLADVITHKGCSH